MFLNTFDLERRTVQKIVRSSLFGNRFSLKISLSLFLSQKLSMNIRKIRYSTTCQHIELG